MAQTMKKTKVRSTAAIKTITRNALLTLTAKHVLHTLEKYTPDGARFILGNLDTILQEQLINGFEIVAFQGGEPITAVHFDIDWNEHTVLKSIKNDVDVSGLEDGQTFVSTLQVTEVVDNYLHQVAHSAPGVEFEFWYFRNSAAEKKFGEEKYDQLMGVAHDPQRRRQNRKRYKSISVMKVASRALKTFFPDAEETSINVFGKK